MFHTRCHVHDKVCIMIIEDYVCKNLASTTMMEKLNLRTLQHLTPYKLPWMNDFGEVDVNKQVLLSFSIGK